MVLLNEGPKTFSLIKFQFKNLCPQSYQLVQVFPVILSHKTKRWEKCPTEWIKTGVTIIWISTKSLQAHVTFFACTSTRWITAQRICIWRTKPICWTKKNVKSQTETKTKWTYSRCSCDRTSSHVLNYPRNHPLEISLYIFVLGLPYKFVVPSVQIQTVKTLLIWLHRGDF